MSSTQAAAPAKRLISGYATTSAPDRVGDVIDHEGVQFALPMPLLSGHDHSKAIGKVTSLRKIGNGWVARAEIVPQGVDAEADRVWSLVKEGVLTGFSVGFRPLDIGPRTPQGGVSFPSVEVHELSVVAVPCNADCKIATVNTEAKSAPQATTPRGAFSGRTLAHLKDWRSVLEDTFVSLAGKGSADDMTVFSRMAKVQAEIHRRESGA